MATQVIPFVLSGVRQWFAPDALRAGDEAAWGDLFDIHYPRLYCFFRYRTRTEEAADQFASEVFLDAHRTIRRHDMRRLPVPAWLFEIAGGMLPSDAGTRARQPQVMSGDAPALHVRDEYITAEVRRLVRLLSSEHRSALELRYMLRLSVIEAAAVMSVPTDHAEWSIRCRRISPPDSPGRSAADGSPRAPEPRLRLGSSR